ncbi:MAG: hypothetical protein H6832_02935 [Planctomycetes bacterium]|nr:hypothetical protein [Planctomycetota bacterium]MCB9917337.1 hypothetical protein [Planctomycetota bacterium]
MKSPRTKQAKPPPFWIAAIASLAACQSAKPPVLYSLSAGSVREFREAKRAFVRWKSIGVEKRIEARDASAAVRDALERAIHLDPMGSNPLLHGLIGDLELDLAEGLTHGAELGAHRQEIDDRIEAAIRAYDRSLGIGEDGYAAREDYLPSRLGLVRAELLSAQLANRARDFASERAHLQRARKALQLARAAHDALVRGPQPERPVAIFGIPLLRRESPSFSDPALSPLDADSFHENLIAEHLEWSAGNPRLLAPRERPADLGQSLEKRLRGRILELEGRLALQEGQLDLPHVSEDRVPRLRQLLVAWRDTLRHAQQFDPSNVGVAMSRAHVELSLDEDPKRALTILEDLLFLSTGECNPMVLAMRAPLRLLIRAQTIVYLDAPSETNFSRARRYCEEVDVQGVRFPNAPDVDFARAFFLGVHRRDAERIERVLALAQQTEVRNRLTPERCTRLADAARSELRRLEMHTQNERTSR